MWSFDCDNNDKIALLCIYLGYSFCAFISLSFVCFRGTFPLLIHIFFINLLYFESSKSVTLNVWLKQTQHTYYHAPNILWKIVIFFSSFFNWITEIETSKWSSLCASLQSCSRYFWYNILVTEINQLLIKFPVSAGFHASPKLMVQCIIYLSHRCQTSINRSK